MRQAGIIAAAGLYALDHQVERLADDHARAAAGRGAGRAPRHRLDPAAVETNIVIFAVPDAAAFTAGLGRRGRPDGPLGPPRVRAVTHLDVDAWGIERALAAAARALG